MARITPVTPYLELGNQQSVLVTSVTPHLELGNQQSVLENVKSLLICYGCQGVGFFWSNIFIDFSQRMERLSINIASSDERGDWHIE